jgi:hypothetical protein
MISQRKSLHISLFFLITLLTPNAAAAQDRLQPDRWMVGNTAIGFEVAPEFKFSTVDGRFAQFVGFHAGIIINHRVTLGLAGYAKATEHLDNGLGYGGFFIDYRLFSHGPVQVSAGGVLGGGVAHEYWYIPWWKDNRVFGVAEPHCKISVGVTDWFRLGLGGSYRFVSGANRHPINLSGPSINLSLEFGLF